MIEELRLPLTLPFEFRRVYSLFTQLPLVESLHFGANKTVPVHQPLVHIPFVLLLIVIA